MSTKRKIEDYKGQKVAIHCSTKEEWDKIVDLFPSNRSVKKNYWQNSVNNGKSDTINIEGYGWSPKKHYEDEGYTIYPASDFLEEIKSISKKDLKKGEIYTITDNHYLNKILIHRYEKMSDEDRSLGSFLTDFNGRWEFCSQSTPYLTGRNISISTPEEKHWFLECEKADKFIPYNKTMKTFSKQNPFKFNIGDEIKAKPGGYYLFTPQNFAEIYKKQFPSEKSRISGKITERTQAQGFNWYRCRYGDNWITEEGVELIKEDIPEYIECIDTEYFISGCSSVNKNNLKKGTIYKVSSKKPESNYSKKIVLEVKKRHIEIGCNDYQTLYKSSTKEAFDLQNKSKNMNEDIFCIELNSQKELDAIMDFYKQKGFKELGNSYEYFNGYVVYIKMKDKKWQTSVCNDLNYPVKTLSELGIEVKSKSLVGRYLKALVDYPDAGRVLKGEIGIIKKENNGIPSEVDFPSQNYYIINSTTYKNGESYELMPEKFKPKDDLISEAKRRYPLGTKFKPAHVNKLKYCIVTEDSVFEKYGDEIVLTVNGKWWIEKGNPKYGNTNYNRYVYYEGKWAEIVSDEPEINTYGLKVGDILKQEIINAWAGIEGNFCPDVQTGWVDVFCRYGGDRKIEDFRDIEGQIGFHVSGCTEGTHYLKAEGFKEFADNFYKKEVKSWIQEQDEILNDVIKQHPLTPKECYSSTEIIIPQVIKAQKKQFKKITIESPTELDLKLKTIKPKQIQTIKI